MPKTEPLEPHDGSAPKELRTLSLFIATHVRNALQAALVTTAAKATFAVQRESFHTNPANTLAYSAMSALEERSLISISELVSTSAPILKLPEEMVAEWDALVPHRHYLSHPGTIDWRPKMQPFIAANGQHLEIRPALIWHALKSMNERLRAADMEPHNEDIEVTPAMASMLHTILRYSVSAEAAPRLWPEDKCQEVLLEYREQYIRFIESTRSFGPVD